MGRLRERLLGSERKMNDLLQYIDVVLANVREVSKQESNTEKKVDRSYKLTLELSPDQRSLEQAGPGQNERSRKPGQDDGGHGRG